MAKLRVLVVDDSAYNRQTISEILNSHPDIEVVGKAYDGEEALKLTDELEPDLITLDLEMPRMDGFTFLRLLMSKMPTPVIVISSHSRKQEVFQALELGALDFIAKPTHHIAPDVASLSDELIAKALTVRALEAMPFRRRASRRRKTLTNVEPVVPFVANTPVTRLVCIGASTGGPPALESLFRAVGSFDGTSFVVAQHMPAKFTKAFADRLNRVSAMNIVEAEAGMPIGGSWVFIAPGGQHMRVVANPRGGLRVELERPKAADRYVPSIDRLFTSVSEAARVPVLTIVMTGMGADGSVGIRSLHRRGSITLAESQQSAIVFGMPKEAIETGCIDEVLPLDALIERVLRFAEGRG